MSGKIDTSYEQDLQINEHRLEWEFARQPTLAMKWSTKHAQAKKELARAEENLKVVRAEVKRAIAEERAIVDRDIRQYPASYGFTKAPTEPAIEKAIDRDKEFKQFCIKQEGRVEIASQEYIEAVEREAIYEGASKAIGIGRKKSLEAMLSLYLTNYYSEPKVGKDVQGMRLERSRQMGDEIRQQMRKGGDGD